MSTIDLQETLERHLGYLAQDSHNWNLLLTISGCYYQLGDLVSAQQYLDDAKQASGENFWAYQGMLHLKSGQLLPAKTALQAALAEEDTPDNRCDLAFCLCLNQEFEEALTILNAILPDQISCQSELLKAKILHHLFHHDEAMALLEQLHAQYPNEPEVSGLLSLLYFDTNQIEQAEKLCKHALLRDSDNQEAILVDILLKTLQEKVTVAEIESRLTVTPEESRLWFALGTTQMRQMNITAAEQSFLKTAEIWPGFYENWTSLAWCYLMQNKLDLAKNAYTKATELDDEHADGWAGLALVSALQDDMTSAQKWLEKTRFLDEECDLLAIADIIMGSKVDPDLAAKQLEKAFPEIAVEVKRILSEATLMGDPGKTVMH